MKEGPYLLLDYLAGPGPLRAWSLMLLHSMWQGLLLHMTAVFLLRYRKRMGAAVMYNLLLLLFFIFLVACGCTLALELSTAPDGPMPGSPVTIGGASAFSWWPLLTWTWLIAFLFRSGRLGWELTSSYWLVRAARGKTNHYWQQRLDQLASLLGIRGRVRLLESSATGVPVILGVLRPVILVPLGVLASMPADQLEAVLLHELAHIRRKDYLVNLIQAAAEAIFFFNPGLRWLSEQLRIEREHCCDDIALGHVDRLTFVRALVSFQEHFLYRRAFPLAFTGQKDRLVARVGRITGRPTSSSRRARLYLLVYLFPMVLMGWFFLNGATAHLQQGPRAVRFSGPKATRKTVPLTGTDQPPVTRARKIAKKEIPHRARAVIQHTGTVSSPIYHPDSIAPVSSAPLAVTALSEAPQSGYAKEMKAYSERMLQYEKQMLDYDQGMVVYKKTLEEYNREMVRHTRTLQANNERIGQQLGERQLRPPD